MGLLFSKKIYVGGLPVSKSSGYKYSVLSVGAFLVIYAMLLFLGI